jgi:hypothetical protein
VADVNVGGGRLEMDTDAVRSLTDNLNRTGDDLAAQLTAIFQRMSANEPGIGTNAGAADFALNYGIAATGLKESAANVDPTFKAFGTSTNQAVADYERADREQAEAIRRAGGE